MIVHAAQPRGNGTIEECLDLTDHLLGLPWLSGIVV
jgi:hypothetical protein